VVIYAQREGFVEAFRKARPGGALGLAPTHTNTPTVTSTFTVTPTHTATATATETGTPTATPPARGSRRRRLWEMAHKCHCPLVGVCFGVDELRGLMARVMHFPRATADFVLHTSAVGACETRGPLSELLHKTLEKRFQADIRRFASAKDSPAVARLWRASVAAGTGIPGALWAAWSHPACDKALEQEIYADIHMLQHQVGTGTRADLGALQALRDENARLRSELADARGEAESLRREKSRESALLGEQAAALRVELAGKEAAAANLAGQLDSLRQALPELRDRQALLRRAGDAESRATALTARVAELERELERRQRVCRPQETTVAAPPAEAAPAGAASWWRSASPTCSRTGCRWSTRSSSRTTGRARSAP